MTRKLLVVGLDGGTFDVLEPLMTEGYMPNLERLVAAGSWGDLQSTVPPVTGPAWLSLATGLAPEKTGVFDFLYFTEIDGNQNLRGVNSSDYAGRAVWDHLGSRGKRVGILNYPMLYPPYEVNGFMSCGIGATADPNFTYPESLKEELHQAAGGYYQVSVPYNLPRYENTGLFLDHLNDCFDRKLRATLHLLETKEWDLFWVVFSETDWIQHLMWKYIDPAHPLYDEEESKKYLPGFKAFWQRIDNALGQLGGSVGETTNILILSDHGFGSNDQVFRINAWLEREGYLVQKQTVRSRNSFARKLYRLSMQIAKGLNLTRFAPHLYKWGRDRMEILHSRVFDQFDLERSRAFDPGHTTPFGAIYINHAIVALEDRREMVVEITQKLQRFSEAEGVDISFWYPTLAQTETARRAPDIIIGINDWRCGVIKDQFTEPIFERKSLSSRHTGSHRSNGILIATGPDVSNCRLNKAGLCDIAPTIIHLLGEPVSSAMDGRVIVELFAEEYMDNHPVDTLVESVRQHDLGQGLSEQEESSLVERLKDLGYL
jgi:predicted AlkP superfamily phosphohydrolase/phosphomutase